MISTFLLLFMDRVANLLRAQLPSAKVKICQDASLISVSFHIICPFHIFDSLKTHSDELRLTCAAAAEVCGAEK